MHRDTPADNIVRIQNAAARPDRETCQKPVDDVAPNPKLALEDMNLLFIHCSMIKLVLQAIWCE